MYARVQIDVDLQHTLPSKILVEREGFSFEVNVSYEKMPDFCTHCSMVGHFVGDCRALKKVQEESSKVHDFKEARAKNSPRKRLQMTRTSITIYLLLILPPQLLSPPLPLQYLHQFPVLSFLRLRQILPPDNASTSHVVSAFDLTGLCIQNQSDNPLSTPMMPSLNCNIPHAECPTPTFLFAPLSGKFWGDEEEEPPIQSFAHSADEILADSTPQQCIQLGEDLDLSILNQETPDNLKQAGYLSSLCSDSSPSLNKNLHSPSDSEFLPSSKSDSSVSFSPRIPLLTCTTSKAKNKQARLIQKQKEEMIKLGIPQSSIDFCFQHKCTMGLASQGADSSSTHDTVTDLNKLSLNLIQVSSCYSVWLRLSFDRTRIGASGLTAVQSCTSTLLSAVHSLSTAQFTHSASVQQCFYGIFGSGSNQLLVIIFSVQYSIQSASSAVAALADSADLIAAINTTDVTSNEHPDHPPHTQQPANNLPPVLQISPSHLPCFGSGFPEFLQSCLQAL
ncbi:hypothetical protein LguiB_027480 [Lonicera macranthoides]